MTPEEFDALDDFTLVGRLKFRSTEPVRLRRRRRTLPLASMIVLGVIVAGCLGYKLLITQDPTYMDLAAFNEAPSSEHWFGTDSMGRDVWSMIWYGGLKSLTIGFLATLISTFIAVVYGTISGLSAPWVDDVMMRFTEILLSVPSILLVIFMQAVLGQRNVLGISLIIGVTSWMNIAKMIRTEVRRIRNSEYVLISRTMGGGFWHILRRHLLPNYVSTIMFMVVMNIRGAIVQESTLSFLGIGLPVRIITWGSMLSLADKALLTGSWWVILIPGIFLVMLILCVTEIGNAIRGRVTRGSSNL